MKVKNTTGNEPSIDDTDTKSTASADFGMSTHQKCHTAHVRQGGCLECGNPEIFILKRGLCKTCYFRDYERRTGRGTSRVQQLRHDHPARSILYHYRHKSKRLGLPFDLDIAWLEERIARAECEVTGLPLIPPKAGEYSDQQSRAPWVMSLDRIDPAQGYTKINSRIVAWIYNTAKSHHTDDEVLKMAEALLSRRRDPK